MKRSHIIIYSLTIIFLLLSPPLLRAQSQQAEMKHFAKEGLVLDYPAAWSLEDNSRQDIQHLVLVRGSSGAQIMFLAPREKVTTPDRLADLRHAITEPLIDSLDKELQKSGAPPQRTAVTIEVGGARAEGTRLSAVLDGVPGRAEVYSLVLGSRLVAVSFIGSETELKEATADWETIRRSVKVEETKSSAEPDKP
jgi:hypothetical protein